MQGLPQGYALGIDVSDNNGHIDWAKVKADGVVFAWAKATEGATIHDPNFKTNWEEMKKYGILRGAYNFARFATSSPLAEAKSFCDTVEAAGGWGELPPVLDMEDAGGKNSTELEADVRTWMAYVKLKSGMQPILYTYVGFANAHLRNLTNIPLWIADYNGGKAPSNCGGWTQWLFYQFTDSLSVGSRHFDGNAFDGTVSDLLAFVKSKGTSVKGGTTVTLLRYGDNNSEVKAMQEKLAYVLGLPASFADGDFGKNTLYEVKIFQTKSKLSVDGIVGDNTMKALDKAYTDKKAAEVKKNAPKPTPKPTPAPAPSTPAPVSDSTAVTDVKDLTALLAQVQDALQKAVQADQKLQDELTTANSTLASTQKELATTKSDLDAKDKELTDVKAKVAKMTSDIQTLVNDSK